MMTFTRLGIGLVSAAITISSLSACSTASDIRKITDAATSAVEQIQEGAGALTGNLLTAEGIDGAVTAISEKVGADPMQVVEVTIVPTALTIQAVDPAAPTELNQWSYTAGRVGDMRPVDYDDDTEALAQNLFAISDVSTAAIMTAVDNAVAASGIADGEVQSVVIKRNLPFDDNVLILLNVQGERSNKQVRADISGQVTDVL